MASHHSTSIHKQKVQVNVSVLLTLLRERIVKLYSYTL